MEKKPEELVRHEVLVPKSLKKWVISHQKKIGHSQAKITVAALNVYRDLINKK